METQVQKESGKKSRMFSKVLKMMATFMFIQFIAASLVMGGTGDLSAKKMNKDSSAELFAQSRIGLSHLAKFIDFSATRSAGAVDLIWQTTTHRANIYFIVQKSFDGVNFKNLAKITSNQSNKYSFKDKELVRGCCFYRIVQISERDGITISKTIRVSSQNYTPARNSIRSRNAR